MDHVADPVLAGERHLRDSGHIHALSRQQHHLRPPPGHYRPTAPAHNPHQPPLAGGVLLAACCLFGFTLIGSTLIERIAWLKPVAGLALIVIGLKLGYDYFRA